MAQVLDTVKEGCIKGDPDAWRDLYRVLFPHAVRIAAAPPFNFRSHDAEDIAQEVMFDLTKRITDVKNPAAFVGVVTHNKCVDHLRKKRELLLAPRRESDGTPSDQNAADVIPAPVEEKLVDNETITLLRNSLTAMGNPCRDLLTFRFFEELAYKEIADKMKFPEKQVGVYLTRCLGNLKDTLSSSPSVWQELRALLG